ncbi:MAG: wobble nucleotide-excising tRNase [Spirosomataceae bacterium]|jgi:wobble nucleotide-excising tRNase
MQFIVFCGILVVVYGGLNKIISYIHSLAGSLKKQNRRKKLSMIQTINLKSVATYDNHGVQLNDLKKINFIYGANGCGKTTISNFVHDTTVPKFQDSAMKWSNDLPIKVLVYNKAFRERNFGKGRLNGVFTLGEATAEQIKDIEEKIEVRRCSEKRNFGQTKG